MPEPDFPGLRSEVGDAVRQPGFDTVRRRAGRVRRRRTVTSAAVVLTTVLTATSLGYTARIRADDRSTAGPAPATGPRMTSVTAFGDDLYGVVVRCERCDTEMYASADGGTSWQRRTVPRGPDGPAPREVRLVALASGVLAWNEATAAPAPEASTVADHLWITGDGGGTWRPAATGAPPVPAIPDGMRPIDCALLEVTACAVGVIDTATGRFAPLTAQPSGITVRPGWTGEVTAPPGGRLWIPGVDPSTRKPAVTTSGDAGRTWRTHVFTGAAAVTGTTARHLPQVAAGPGATAYALTYRADGTADAHVTTDGGATWHQGGTIRQAWSFGQFVAADGAHVVLTGTGPVAGRGTGRYDPVTLPGYPADSPHLPQVTTRDATEPYLVPAETGPYLSRDGRTWRRIGLP